MVSQDIVHEWKIMNVPNLQRINELLWTFIRNFCRMERLSTPASLHVVSRPGCLTTNAFGTLRNLVDNALLVQRLNGTMFACHELIVKSQRNLFVKFDLDEEGHKEKDEGKSN